MPAWDAAAATTSVTSAAKAPLAAPISAFAAPCVASAQPSHSTVTLTVPAALTCPPLTRGAALAASPSATSSATVAAASDACQSAVTPTSASPMV